MKGQFAVLLLLAVHQTALGQWNPYQPPPTANDPRVRRAWREQAVAYTGPIARALIESELGDEAASALLACTPPTARKIAEWFNRGELTKLSRPRDMLKLISQQGAQDEVALFAMQHSLELTDVDTCDAYLLAPLDYCLGLKPLATGAAEMRARRLAAMAPPPAPQTGFQMPYDWRLIAGACGGIAIIGLLWWRKRSRG